MKMFYKRCIIFCTFLLIFLSVSGCEKAPDDSGTSDDKKTNEVSSEQFVSLAEAKKQVQSLEGANIDGLQFPKNILMPDIDQIYDIRLTTWGSIDAKKSENLIKNLWKDYSKVDWDSIQAKKFDSKMSDYVGYEKKDEKTGRLFGYDSDGFFVGNSMNGDTVDGEWSKHYDLEWDDAVTEQDVYTLEDGEVSVAAAVNYTESRLNQYLYQYENEKFQYKVQHVYVYKNKGEDFYTYYLVIGRIYQDVYVDTVSDFNLSEGKYYSYTHCGNHIIGVMKHKDRLDSISTGDGCLKTQSETAQDQIISPLWAVQKIQEEVAHIGGINFEYCGLVYLLEQENRLVANHEQDVYQGCNDTTKLRPVWLFAVSPGGTRMKVTTDNVYGASVLVDALDGSLYYYEGTGGY